MLETTNFNASEILGQNCRIGKTYPSNCVPGVLCSPKDEFDMIEGCNKCDKQI